MLNSHELSKDDKYAKGYLVRQLAELKNEKVISFLKQLYVKSYSEPETQIDITYRNVSLNQELRFPFKIPSNYKEIQIEK